MTIISPTRKTVDQIKSQLLNPALTSHFQAWFTPPTEVISWMKEQSDLGYGSPYSGGIFNGDAISIACMDASLPGSSMMTHEQNNDFHGVTQRHVYRRDYGSGVDFTFMVDNNHQLLFFIENWLRFIVNERIPGDPKANQDYPSMESSASYSRVRYPSEYKTFDGLYITKYERDYESSLGCCYKFIDAFPVSVTSMPISYEASQLLKCTVTFTYSRYYLTPLTEIAPPEPQALTPSVSSPTEPLRDDIGIWVFSWAAQNYSILQPNQKLIVDKYLQAYPPGSAARAALRQRAITGNYTVPGPNPLGPSITGKPGSGPGPLIIANKPLKNINF